jgi:N-acetylneuraminic acid mutarotase
MSSLWQRGTVSAIGLAWLAMSAADSLSQTPPTGTWEERADVSYRVQEIYPAFHKGQLYLAGGFSPDVGAVTQQISDRVYIYDPINDTWRQGASLPEPRHHPYLVSSGEKLFSFGGFVAANGGRWSASTDILMLDESANRWVKVGDLLHPQSETVAGLIDGRIYLASGRKPGGERNADWNDQVDIDQVQVFDPATYAVSAGPAAPSARNSAAGAVIDGKLYVVGGRVVGEGNKTANEVFDPANGSWETLAPMPNAQGGIAAAALDGKLYVFGGEFFGSGGGGVYEESWVYDPAGDAWEPVTSMPVPRHGLGAVTIGDEIYVVAGASEAGGSGTTNRLAVFQP